MGFGNSGNGSTWVHVSNGKMRNKKATPPIECDSFTGKLVGLNRFMDAYEGKDIPKLVIQMADDKTGEIVNISCTDDTVFSCAFFSRIMAVDLSQPFLLGCFQNEETAAKKITLGYIKQGGAVIKKDETFPKSKEVKMGTVTGRDWTPVHDKVAEIVKYLQSKGITYKEESPKGQAGQLAAPPANDAPPLTDDDLPF
jgi:hypothetical protein